MHEAIRNLFINPRVTEKIHKAKDAYGATVLREQTRTIKMDRQIKKSRLYKAGQLEVLKDIDIILTGGTIS